MQLAAIADYRTLLTTDNHGASTDYGLDNDWIIILELTRDKRATVHKARIVATEPAPFKPLFHSWHGEPCNWQG